MEKLSSPPEHPELVPYESSVGPFFCEVTPEFRQQEGAPAEALKQPAPPLPSTRPPRARVPRVRRVCRGAGRPGVRRSTARSARSGDPPGRSEPDEPPARPRRLESPEQIAEWVAERRRALAALAEPEQLQLGTAA